MIRIFAIMLSLTVSAFAQQQTEITPSQFALGIQQQVGQLAQAAEKYRADLAATQKKLDEAQAKIKELQDSAEHK